MTPGFTEEDAKHVLNWYVGSGPLTNILRSTPPEGVIAAVRKLGGAYQIGWGITKLPTYKPVDEV